MLNGWMIYVKVLINNITMNRNIIKKYEDIALSDKHMFKLLDGKNNLVLYPNLINYDNIDDVLGDYGMCTLLFEAKKNYGHWCCLWKQSPDTVSFFNSYGGYPDDSLKYIPEHFARISNQDYPYLSILLNNSPYKLTYNEYAYQKLAKDIKTCGRHVCVRLFCRELTDNQYHKFIKEYCKKYNVNADQLVTLMTMHVTT
jgi:hypothetical protein